jgi:hypothetical protein
MRLVDVRSVRNRLVQVRSGYIMLGHIRWVRLGHLLSCIVRSSYVTFGHDMSSYVKLAHVWSGEFRIFLVRSCYIR